MATIPEICEFVCDPAKTYLQTNANGDTITIAGVHLSQENAATLAWLMNQDSDLRIEIKIN